MVINNPGKFSGFCMRVAGIFLLILLFIPASGTPGSQSRKTLYIRGVKYYPLSMEEKFKESLLRMLFTRFSPYFRVEEKPGGPGGKNNPSLELSVTRIGESISIDSLLVDGSGKAHRDFVSGKKSGDLPGMLEQLAWKVNVAANGADSRLAYKKELTGLSTRKGRKSGKSGGMEKYLPKGKLTFSPSYSGGYTRFSGGRLTGDVDEEVLAAGENRVTVIRTADSGMIQLYSYELSRSQSVIYLSCGDIDRDGLEEGVVTLSTGSGSALLIIDYDKEKKLFRSVYKDRIIARVYNDLHEGSVLLTQKEGPLEGDGTGMFLSTMLNGDIKELKEVVEGRGMSITNAFPLNADGRYKMVIFGRAGDLFLKDNEDIKIEINGVLDEIRAMDIGNDGNQELMLFISSLVPGSFFDSVNMSKGFKIQVYRLDERGFKKAYSFDNEAFPAGGFFPKIQASGGRINQFVVIALSGNDFFPDSIMWKKVTIR